MHIKCQLIRPTIFSILNVEINNLVFVHLKSNKDQSFYGIKICYLPEK